MNNDKKLLIYLIAGITILRLIYVNFVPLLPQEAYYWKYAKNLALSYFDHPPMTAYIIAFFTWIGGDKIFFIRFGSILLSVGLMIIIYTITKRLFLNQNTRCSITVLLGVNYLLFSAASRIKPLDMVVRSWNGIRSWIIEQIHCCFNHPWNFYLCYFISITKKMAIHDSSLFGFDNCFYYFYPGHYLELPA
jgi:hypothetical protein